MNYEQTNQAYVSGEIIEEPTYTHTSFGEGFYEMTLSVARLSGQMDLIPVTISERLMETVDLSKGNYVSVEGQFRSYNKIEENKSKLMLSVFARAIGDHDENVNPNQIEVKGYICKEPMYRTTPFKREICDVLVAVNRAYNKSDYIPCIAWGRNARYVNSLSVGDKIDLNGRIQSRNYQKVTEDGTVLTKTAYEVSICGLTIERQTPAGLVINPKAV
ncbi:MAG: single-stranded DNA-binding protein [Clostridia bacterium]|nr:single-stranded DNA-binding protein [Clostridia bacterium]